jgi:PAS domain S-box-containing protein
MKSRARATGGQHDQHAVIPTTHLSVGTNKVLKKLPKRSKPLLSQVIVPLATIIVLIASFGITRYLFGNVFQFGINGYAFLSLLCLITTVILLFLVSRLESSGEYLLWFGLYLITVIFWSAGEFLNRSAHNPVSAIFWSSLSSMGAIMLPPMLFLFVFTYVSPKSRRHLLTVVTLIGGGLLLSFLDFHTNLFNMYSPNLIITRPWGYVTGQANYWWVLLLWDEFLYVSSMTLLVRFYRRTPEPLLKQQAKLFIIGFSLPLVVGTITDGILPAVGVQVLALAVVLISVMNVIIAYSIIRYKFFTFDPAIIATSILDTMNEAVIGLHSDLTMNYTNSVAEKMFGQSSDELVRLKFTDVLPPTWSADRFYKTLIEPLRSSEYSQIESIDLSVTAGKDLIGKIAASTVLYEQQLKGYILVITDITEISKTQAMIEETVIERTHQLQDSQSQLLATIRILPFGFAVIGQDDKIAASNDILKTLMDKLHPGGSFDASENFKKSADTIKTVLDIYKIIETVRVKQVQVEKNIEFGPDFFRFLFIPILGLDERNQHQIIGTAVILEETTEVKARQRSRDEFFSIASHELRTPLTAIRGNTDMILNYYKDQLKDPSLNQMVQDVYDSSVRLIDIVNGFLDMSRLEQGKVNFKNTKFDIVALVKEIIKEDQVLVGGSASAKVKLRVESPAKIDIFTDADRVRQILNNLVGNAIKFTEKGSVTIKLAIQGQEYIKVSVSDNGKGIPLGSQHLLFHKFQQATDNILTRDSTRSTGLGLYISKLIADGLKGKLYLESSSEDDGSIFVLELPIENKVTNPDPAPEA